MKKVLIILLLGTCIVLQAGEHDKIRYSCVSITIDLPGPYKESELIILCSKSSVDMARVDTNRVITDMKLITQSGTIEIPKKYYQDLFDPDYPILTHFLIKEGHAIFINMTCFDLNLNKSNLWIKIIDNKVVDTKLTKIEPPKSPGSTG